MDPLGSLGSLGSTLEAIWFSLEILWKPLGNPLESLGSSIGSQIEARVVQRDAKGRPRGNQKNTWGPLGFLGSTLEAIWDSLETLWKPIGNPLGPLGSSIGSQTEARVVQRGAKGRPTEARVVQRDAKGRPRGGQKDAWEAALGTPWGQPGQRGF